MNIAAVVLAAGKGTRFQSTNINKIALPLAGKPIILYGIELLEELGIKDIFIVVGFARESVEEALSGHRVSFIEQKEQLGTAHAISSVFGHIPSSAEHILVINGDDPFHRIETVKRLIEAHKLHNPAITFATAELDNPDGTGRIVRDSKGKVMAIVEEKDATEEQRKIKEVNGGCYIFSISFLKQYIPGLEKSSVTGEYYLTDLIGLAVNNGEKVEIFSVGHKRKGINTPQDLKEAEELLKSQV